MKSTYSKILIASGLALIFLTVSQSAAAKVALKLHQPDKFSDIEVTNQNQKRSINSLTNDMTKLFESSASKYISDDKVLVVNITDVDLPGRIQHMVGPNHEELRVIRDNDSFKLIFNYKLKDKSGSIIKEGKAKLKNFLSHSPDMRRKLNRTTTDYFEKTLNKWFKKEFQ